MPVEGGPAPFVYCSKAKPGQSIVPKNLPMENPGSGGPHCGIFDVGCMAGQAITGWFGDLVKQAANSTLKLLGKTVLSTPDINSKEMARARQLWGVSQTIANTCFVLLITFGGIVVMAGTSLPHEFGPKEILPRLVLAFLAANLSLQFIEYAITLANGLAHAFLEQGAANITPAGAATALLTLVTASIQSNQVFMILLALAVVVLATCVAFVYIVRITITVLLVAAAPLALMFHAFPFTEGLARLWWRGLAGMLAIQVCQALIFVTALQILFTDNPANTTTSTKVIPTNGPDAMDLLTIICLMWVLLRIPSWVARTIWQQARPRLIPQLIKTFLVYRGVGAVLGKAATMTRAKSTRPPGPNGRRGPGPGGQRRSGGPGPRGPRGGPGQTGGPGNSGASRTGAHQNGTGSTGTPSGSPSTNSPGSPGPRPQPGTSANGTKPAPRSAQAPRYGPGQGYHPSHGGFPTSAPTQPPPQTRQPAPPHKPVPRPPREVVTLRIDPPPRRRTKTSNPRPGKE